MTCPPFARRLTGLLLLLIFVPRAAHADPPLASLKAQLQQLALPFAPDTTWFAQGVPSNIKALNPQMVQDLVLRPLYSRYGDKALAAVPTYQTALMGLAYWGHPKRLADAAQMLTATGTANAQQPEIRRLYAVGVLNLRPDVESVVLYEDARFICAQTQTYYLLNFHPSGVLIDGMVLSSRHQASGQAIAQNGEVSVKGLTISNMQRIVSQQLNDKSRTLICDVDRSLSLLSDGRIVQQDVHYLTYTGFYVDALTGEELQFVQTAQGLDVAYYAGDGTPARKLWITRQEAQADRLTVRFGGSENDYVLSFGNGRHTLVCLNPDGTEQVFVRQRDF